jgi:hypothetical protein
MGVSNGHELAALPPGKNAGIHWIEDWVDSRDKALEHAEFKPQLIQPVS